MRFLLLTIFILSVFLSCKNATETSTKIESTIAESQKSKKMSVEPILKLPKTAEGCTCRFSKSMDDFKSGEFLYVDDLAKNAILKINGKLEELNLKDSREDGKKGFIKTWENGKYDATIESYLLKKDGKISTYTSKLSVKSKDGQFYDAKLMGQCGC